MSEENTQERDVQKDATTDHQEASQESKPESKEVKQEIKQAKDDNKVDVRELEKAQARIQELNKENEKRRFQVKEWEELGVDPETVKKWQQDIKQAEEKRKREEGRFEELLQEMREQTEAEKQRIESEAQEKLSKMQSAVEKHLVDKTIAETLSSEGVKAPKLLSRYMKDYVRTVEEDGEYKTVVLDDDGEIRTKRGGAKFTVDDFVNELKGSDEFASVFPAPKVSGTGSEGTSSRPVGNNVPRKPRSQMNSREKAEFQKAYGFEEYYKLPLN